MANCPGKDKSGRSCFNQIYQCPKCLSVGCKKDGCTNQTFNGTGRCLKCGSVVTPKPF